MAAPSSPTGTIQHKAYAKLSNSASVNTVAKVEALTSLSNCIAFGPISATGNPSEWTPMGEGTTKSIAGAASLGELTVRIVATESNSLHSALLSADVGDKIEAGIVKVSGSDKVAYYAYGTLASKEITFETPAEFGFTIALAANVSRIT